MRRLPLLLLLLAGCATTSSARVDGIGLRKQLARSLVEHHEYQAAMTPLAELTRMAPRDPEVYVLLGTAYREQGVYEEAERHFDHAIALDGNRGDAWGGRGLLREERRDEGDAALADFKKAIELQPGNAAHYNNLGFALYVRGKYEDAVKVLRDGLRHAPGSRRMRNNLGFVYGQLGFYNRAWREFERGGSRAEAESNLGLVYERAGDVVAACDRYREAAKLDPTLAGATANADHICPKPETRRE